MGGQLTFFKKNQLDLFPAAGELQYQNVEQSKHAHTHTHTQEGGGGGQCRTVRVASFPTFILIWLIWLCLGGLGWLAGSSLAGSYWSLSEPLMVGWDCCLGRPPVGSGRRRGALVQPLLQRQKLAPAGAMGLWHASAVWSSAFLSFSIE